MYLCYKYREIKGLHILLRNTFYIFGLLWTKMMHMQKFRFFMP